VESKLRKLHDSSLEIDVRFPGNLQQAIASQTTGLYFNIKGFIKLKEHYGCTLWSSSTYKCFWKCV